MIQLAPPLFASPHVRSWADPTNEGNRCGVYARQVSLVAPLGESLARVLRAAENSSPAMAVEAVTRELKSAIGAAAVSFLIADLSGRGLVRIESGARGKNTIDPAYPPTLATRTVLPFDGGPAERAVRTQTVQVVAPANQSSGDAAIEGRWLILAPVTERGEAIGLLEMYLPTEPDQTVLAAIAQVAHVLAFVVIANGRHTDVFELERRQVAISLPAEIQRRLLPDSFTCEASAFTLAGWVEPAATIAGDTFDYSLGNDELHLSLTDAMGHGVSSALIATLCVGSLRNTRLQGLGIVDQAAEANTALYRHGSAIDHGFASGLLARVDLRTGVTSLINGGHVPPLLLRAGVVSTVEVPVHPPFGILADTKYRSSTSTLLEGDRLVFITDGLVERKASGLDLIRAIQETSHLHPREATRAMADSVVEVSGGELEDDATLILLDWHGDHSAERTTDSGADIEASNLRG